MIDARTQRHRLRTTRPLRAGFSLMEVMIAVAIVALIATILGGTLARQVQARELIEAHTERANTARIAMNRMAREISMAYLSKHYNCTDRRSITLFKGRGKNRELLTFTALSHYKWRRDAHEADTAEISYRVDADPDQPGKHALLRRESRRITNEPGETGEEYVLAHNIDDVELSFYNQESDRWEEDWDTTRSEQKFKLPLFVKVTMTLPMADKQKQTFHTQTRIMVQDALSFGPNVCMN